MKRAWMTGLIALAFVAGQAGFAQVARPGDGTVKKQMESVQKAVQQFERSLDSKLKRGTIRGRTTEVNVENFLDDFNTDIERMRDRFTASYSASAEVATVLEKSGNIETFVKRQPPDFRGRSEWDVVAAALNQLAAAYGTSFPTPADAPPRRINDLELVQATEAISKYAGPYRKSLKGAFPAKEDAAALSAAQKSVEALSDAAGKLRSRLKGGKPASGEVAVLDQRFAEVKTAVADRTVSESGAAAWKELSRAMATIDQGFGVAPR